MMLDSAITVRMKFFGPVRDVLACDELRWEVPAPATGDAAFESLAAKYPVLLPWKKSIMLAVNLEYVSFSHVLHPDDEVSFIPPVSGG